VQAPELEQSTPCLPHLVLPHLVLCIVHSMYFTYLPDLRGVVIPAVAVTVLVEQYKYIPALPCERT
jgi:hypothetical protein